MGKGSSLDIGRILYRIYIVVVLRLLEWSELGTFEKVSAQFNVYGQKMSRMTSKFLFLRTWAVVRPVARGWLEKRLSDVFHAHQCEII